MVIEGRGQTDRMERRGDRQTAWSVGARGQTDCMERWVVRLLGEERGQTAWRGEELDGPFVERKCF
jgi:hypothetical protein